MHFSVQGSVMNSNLIVILTIGLCGIVGSWRSTPASIGESAYDLTPTTISPSVEDDSGPGSKPGTTTPSLESALLKDHYRFVPLTREKQNSELFVRCTVNGKPILLLVDTGFSCSSLSQDVAEALGLEIKESSEQIATVGTEAKKSKVALVNEFRVSDSSSVSIDFCVADFSALRKVARDAKQIVHDGVLGANWLAQYSCAIDFGSDR